MAKKNYAVALRDGAAEELGPAFTTLLLHKTKDQYYFLACKIDPNGSYFHMTIAQDGPDGKPADMDIQIPHHYVKYVLSAADMKALGFLQDRQE